MKELKDKINASNKLAKLHSVAKNMDFEYEVFYSYKGFLFSFFWVCDFYKVGNMQAYYMFNAECDNKDFQDLLWDCIDLKESKDNPLLTLYLELKDNFVDIFDCLDK